MILPLAVTREHGIAAAARVYAEETAVLEAIVVLEVKEVASESFDCREAGVTATVASVPACVSASVANSVTPGVAVEA
jgi:hypothetical protein